MGRLTEFFGLVNKTLDKDTRSRTTSYVKRARFLSTLKVQVSGDSTIDPHSLDYLLVKRYRRAIEKGEEFSIEKHRKLNYLIWKRLEEKKEMEKMKELQKKKK
jgi:hypothetical protein